MLVQSTNLFSDCSSPLCPPTIFPFPCLSKTSTLADNLSNCLFDSLALQLSNKDLRTEAMNPNGTVLHPKSKNHISFHLRYQNTINPKTPKLGSRPH